MPVYEIAPPYIDEFGLIQDKTGRTGNGIRYSADFMIAVRDSSMAEEIMIERRSYGGILACELLPDSPGVFRRHPVHFATDQNSVDDYTALGTASHLMGHPELAKRILLHGRENDWFFINEPNMEPEAYFGRFAAMITHLEWCAGETPTMLDRLAWCVAVAGSGLGQKNKEDPWILSLHLVCVAGNKGWPEQLATLIFNWRNPFKKWSDCYAENFQDEMHPVVLAYRARGR